MKHIHWLWFGLTMIALPVHADDDTWHNVYDSLRHVGHSVKDAFTDDDSSKSQNTRDQSGTHHSTRHRKGAKKKTASDTVRMKKQEQEEGKPAALRPSPSPSPRESSAKTEPSPSPKAAPKETPADSPAPAAQSSPPGVKVASLLPSQMRDFDAQPPRVQQMLRDALSLTQQNLSYKYGSADPAKGGMDCSGFIYYVLSNAGYKDAPRDSSQQYLWVRKNSNFHAVLSRNADTFELDDLKPGDLMFWSGTYQVNRDIPITHVMIYLGREKGSGKRIMVGASEGRTYDGQQRYGVSVFDFKLPNGQPNKTDPDLTAKFEGYASVPGLAGEKLASATPSPESAVSPTPEPSATRKSTKKHSHRTTTQKKD